MNRKRVYELIDEEREYQTKWDEQAEENGGFLDADKPIECWVLYMESYIASARNRITHGTAPEAMSNIRKVAALAVAAMEYHDAPSRVDGT